jgi:hypothetical protein
MVRRRHDFAARADGGQYGERESIPLEVYKNFDISFETYNRRFKGTNRADEGDDVYGDSLDDCKAAIDKRVVAIRKARKLEVPLLAVGHNDKQNRFQNKARVIVVDGIHSGHFTVRSKDMDTIEELYPYSEAIERLLALEIFYDKRKTEIAKLLHPYSINTRRSSRYNEPPGGYQAGHLEDEFEAEVNQKRQASLSLVLPDWAAQEVI